MPIILKDIETSPFYKMGEARGEACGEARGEARGEEKGLEKGFTLAAERMIAQGFEDALIQTVTGLSLEKIQTLRGKILKQS